jgi:hypothetical protein
MNDLDDFRLYEIRLGGGRGRSVIATVLFAAVDETETFRRLGQIKLRKGQRARDVGALRSENAQQPPKSPFILGHNDPLECCSLVRIRP